MILDNEKGEVNALGILFSTWILGIVIALGLELAEYIHIQQQVQEASMETLEILKANGGNVPIREKFKKFCQDRGVAAETTYIAKKVRRGEEIEFIATGKYRFRVLRMLGMSKKNTPTKYFVIRVKGVSRKFFREHELN